MVEVNLFLAEVRTKSGYFRYQITPSKKIWILKIYGVVHTDEVVEAHKIIKERIV